MQSLIFHRENSEKKVFTAAVEDVKKSRFVVSSKLRREGNNCIFYILIDVIERRHKATITHEYIFVNLS